MEGGAGGRGASVEGAERPPAGTGSGSAALLLAADARAAAVVSLAAPRVDNAMRRTTRRRVAAGAGAALTGVGLFLARAPASGPAAAVLPPLRAWRGAHAPARPAGRRGDGR